MSSEVFLSPEIDIVRTEKRQAGTIYTSTATMRDGRTYKVVSAEPHHRSTDVPATATTAFGTKINAGLNARMLDICLELGVPSDQVSIEQSLSRRTSLARAAHNQLDITRATAELYDRDQDNVRTYGISRAAMVGIFMNAVAPKHSITVVNNDWMAPCFAQTRGPVSYLKNTPELLANEIVALVRGAASHTPKDALGYARTVDPSIVGMIQNFKTIPDLISAATNKAIRAMPRNTRGSLNLIDGDRLSQPEQWTNGLMKEFPNIDINVAPYFGHLGIVHPGIIEGFAERTEKSLCQPLGEAALRLA